MSKVVTFGEIMLKLATPGYQRFGQANQLSVEFSGAEANVAVCLSKLGIQSSFITKLPNNDLGDAAIGCLKYHGVCTDKVSIGGNRIGIYFTEKGASHRPSRVIYDRAHSAISEAFIEDFDWDEIFEGAMWFHFTGITPALSDNVANICLEACKMAKYKGLNVSCDLNYRSKLWSKDKARSIMNNICRYVDICIANETDSQDVFGINPERLIEKFGFKKIFVTQRESYSASDNGWYAKMYDKNNVLYSDKYNIHIVDRIGGGDAFAAGVIYGMLNNFDDNITLNFAVATSCLKQTIEGDFNLVTLSEVKALMEGDASGRIQR